MESDNTSILHGSFSGKIILSTASRFEHATIVVSRIDNLSVRIALPLLDDIIRFHATVSLQTQGPLLSVKPQQINDYFVKGLNGYLEKKPNVHGGLLEKTSEFYVHLEILKGSFSRMEMFFSGKKV